MTRHCWISSNMGAAVFTAILLSPMFVIGQQHVSRQNTAAAETQTAAEAKAWTVPRTPDGQPDLQGYWTSLSFTPMERPAKYGGREFLTDKRWLKSSNPAYSIVMSLRTRM